MNLDLVKAMLRCNSTRPAKLCLVPQDFFNGEISGVDAAQRRAVCGWLFHESDMQSA
ncbi:hypothetical protein [Caulobacter soli]|uniref:hypothetical protein n=1 Tax=Caulobacter soli TaxID=2708539 RepID=UPI0013EB1332|nr:hypothetical protein [Caulobacter soli]